LSLTHFYARSTGGVLKPNPFFLSAGLWSAFLERLAPLLPLTALLIFQFEYLNKHKMASPAAFIERLRRLLGAA
jgi:hypothetical protein